jgi:hypothetical protein
MGLFAERAREVYNEGEESYFQEADILNDTYSEI